MNFAQVGHTLSVWLVPLVVAIVVHEVAHGWVADKLGDDTARMQGRITLNPIRHVDPFGTVILPLMLVLFSGGRVVFGYAKPVPVAFHRLNNPKRDMVWVALAGPGVNIAMAVATGLLVHGVGQLNSNPFTLWISVQPLELHRRQRDAGGVQHAADPAARRRPRADRPAAGPARLALRPARALRHAGPAAPDLRHPGGLSTSSASTPTR